MTDDKGRKVSDEKIADDAWRAMYDAAPARPEGDVRAALQELYEATSTRNADFSHLRISNARDAARAALALALPPAGGQTEKDHG